MRTFKWNAKDFEAAKEWAKSKPDPNDPSRSLWDVIYSKTKESTEIIAQINKHIKSDLT